MKYFELYYDKVCIMLLLNYIMKCIYTIIISLCASSYTTLHNSNNIFALHYAIYFNNHETIRFSHQLHTII